MEVCFGIFRCFLKSVCTGLSKPTFRSVDSSEVKKMTGQKPLCRIQAGQVTAALWENKITAKNGNEVELLKVTVQRRFKDKEGNWKSSSSFGRNDIPLAIYCLGKAFGKIVEEQAVNSSSKPEEEIVM
jgi:hypothetical protein